MSSFRIVLVFFVVAAMGIGLATHLSLSFTPQPLTSSFAISYSLAQATPLVVEQQATALLENALSEIDGIKKLYSRSSYGSGTIEIEFDANEDLAFKKIEIITTLRRLKTEMPERMSFPSVSEGTSDSEEEEPLLIYAISSSRGISYVQDVINQTVIPKLSAIEGIEEVSISGTNQSAIAVNYNAERLRAAGIQLSALKEAISDHASVSFQNSLVHHDLQLPLVVGNQLDLSLVKEIPLTKEITLSDVSEIYLTEKHPGYINRINGKEALLLSVYARKGVNRIATGDLTEERLQEINSQQNSSLSIIKRYDDTTFLKDEIHKAYYRSAFSILILSLFILIFTLKWRQLIILFSGLMVNIGMVLLFAYLIGLDIHLYTLAGLTVSFGLLVDNALVMLDHYGKYQNRKILPGLIAASLTTIVAVGIIFFLPPEDRQNLTDFAWIVILSLSCSLFIAWLFTPAMHDLVTTQSSQKTGRNHAKKRKQVKIFKNYHRLMYWFATKKRWIISMAILAFGLPIYLLPNKWEGQDWYNKTIGSDYYQEEARPYVDRVLGGASRLFYRNVFEGGGFRDAEKTRLYVQAQLSFGHTLSQMDHTIRQVEDYLQTIEGTSIFLTYIYSGTDAQIVIEFDENQEHSSLPYILKNQLTAKALDWGGVDWSIYGVGQGFSNATGESLPNFRVQLKGHQFDKLSQLADIFSKKLLAHKRIQAVNTNDHLSWRAKDLEELELGFNNNYFNFPAADINQALQHATNESYQDNASLYITLNNKRLPVYIEKERTEDFSPFYLMHHSFETVPLHSIASITHQTGIPEIHKENRQYLRMVSFDYFGSANFGQKYLDEVIAEMEDLLPAGFEIKTKSFSWFSEKEKRQYELIPFLILAIYLICLIFFENFKQPFLIILIIPVSFIGLFLIFAWGDFLFDQGGYAAFLMLGGLVVNSAIFIFSDYRIQPSRIQARRVTKAIYQKAWPITLTVISTCVGLIPFLINGEKEVFWFSLAIGMIGGLTFSTFVVLFILPALMINHKNSHLSNSK